ncbi:response regulator transcription factor [Crocinitomicaceae bacterium]|jgi:two-component system, OmpR family, alkaline phosphatase synthesis response regulator PhoP|nr:response regulator transcription factor [Crocinitomicaceae bacterium]
MNKSVLIVDDDEDIRTLLEYNLSKEGFQTFCAENGVEAIKIAKEVHPDLILLDIMMPEMDGMEVCETLRSTPGFENTYICFLTARGEDYSQVAGLDAGADDYVTKPIKMRVLISRIKAVFRRNLQNGSTNSSNELRINRNKYVVEKGNDEIQLPRKEFELIALLMSKPDNVFQRSEILDTVWGTDIVVGDRTIDVHIRKLREKLGDELIVTVKGVGYKYSTNEKKS